MTVGRALAWYAGAGAALAAVLAAADGFRGLCGCGVAWLVCLVPLVFPAWSRRVAGRAAGPRIGGGWGMLHTGDILFRLAWTLGAGAGLYRRWGAALGAGFWVALLVLYQVMLALRTAGLVRAAHSGDRATDAPG